MKAPDEIQIIGSTIKTVYEDRLLDELGSIGQTNPAFNEIRLRKKLDNRKLDDNRLFETWFHEVVHTILDKLGYKELSDDDLFVRSLSSVLVQVIRQL